MDYYYIKWVALLGCCFVLLGCGDAEEVGGVEVGGSGVAGDGGGSAVVGGGWVEPEEIGELLKDGRLEKVDGKQDYRVYAEVYDAPVLGLGEFYKKRGQLGVAGVRKIVGLTHLVDSSASVRLEDKGCVFETDLVEGESGDLVSLRVDVQVHGLGMKFSTALRPGAFLFYEMSMKGNSGRVYVLVLSVEKMKG